jgi:hypothetical protein
VTMACSAITASKIGIAASMSTPSAILASAKTRPQPCARRSSCGRHPCRGT